jgi:hypothetical protein
MSEDLDDNVRKNILLRLSAGCMDAAKNIALETMDGTNSPVTGKEGFFLIDLFAKLDPIYRSGIEAAPSFKKLQRQHYSFAGVSSDSAVTNYPYLLKDDTCMRTLSILIMTGYGLLRTQKPFNLRPCVIY